MVKDSRASAFPGAIHNLNVPLSIDVEHNQAGTPLRVRWLRQWQLVHAVQDLWRIDDEWWLWQPISRMYFRVMLSNGVAITLFFDLKEERWYQQSHV